MQLNKSSFILLSIFLLVACATISSASLNSELRCQCITTVSMTFRPRQIEKVELIPSGPHCPNIQVIATLKKGKKACLDPTTKWVQRIIERLLKSASQKL
ncbi:interleukin-8-like [Discoglossus pictus]